MLENGGVANASQRVLVLDIVLVIFHRLLCCESLTRSGLVENVQSWQSIDLRRLV